MNIKDKIRSFDQFFEVILIWKFIFKFIVMITVYVDKILTVLFIDFFYKRIHIYVEDHSFAAIGKTKLQEIHFPDK